MVKMETVTGDHGSDSLQGPETPQGLTWKEELLLFHENKLA